MLECNQCTVNLCSHSWFCGFYFAPEPDEHSFRFSQTLSTNFSLLILNSDVGVKIKQNPSNVSAKLPALQFTNSMFIIISKHSHMLLDSAAQIYNFLLVGTEKFGDFSVMN